MSNKVRFLIIGFGNIGRRHAEHIINNPDTELVGVCDIDPSVKAHVPEGMPFYSGLREMLRMATSADVLSVCTPNYLHEPHAIAGMKAGWHVVVEKPMALSVSECDRMIETANATGKTIFAVKQNRYNPPVQAVKKLI